MYSGWYTWHNILELVFDPVVIEMVEASADPESIIEYCKNSYGEDHYYGGARGLYTSTIPMGSKFIIDADRNDDEHIELEDNLTWLEA